MEWISAGILAAQIIIAVVSYLTLHRHRVVYGLSTAVLRLPKGSRDDVHALQTEHIDDKLRSAKYTVLQIVERPADGDLEIILGQIKK
jgi:hypothetical protein